MKIRAKTLSTLSLGLVLALFSLSPIALPSFGDVDSAAVKAISPDSYELRYLGCKPKKDSNTPGHIGLFLFIWEGQNTTKVLAYLSPNKKDFLPFASFGVHHESGWQTVGEWCGTGTRWFNVQPGRVIPFSMDMDWIERDLPGYPPLKGADKARFYLSSKDGGMVSDEFPLPLVPTNGK